MALQGCVTVVVLALLVGMALYGLFEFVTHCINGWN